MKVERTPPDAPGRPPFFRTPLGWGLCALIALFGVLIWVAHDVHLVRVLPLMLPLLICVGMHLLMHRGHGGRH